MTAPHECPSVEALAALAELSEGDARVQALAACPRCRARMLAYREFLTPGPAAAGARLDAARAALDAALARELGDAPAVVAPVRPVAAPQRRSWFEALFAPALRPAWGLALVAILAAGVWVAQQPAPRILRGDDAPTVVTHDVEQRPGAAVLDWESVPGATRYEVRFYAQDLSDLATMDAGDARAFTLEAGALPQGLKSGEKVSWQVVALAGHDELARSRMESVVAP